MSGFSRAFEGVIKNTHPEETVDGGLVEGGGSSRGTGDGVAVGVSLVIEAGCVSSSTSMSSRDRGSGRRGGRK